jgi:DNA helicase-2/ATP-dependent DNA helicase PcrA
LANEVLHKVYNKEVVSAIPYPRHGEKPNLLVVTTEEKLFLRLEEELSTANKLNSSNIGILTKSEKDAAVFRYLLNKGINSRLILKRDQTFNLQKGITILPINLSKGLEFEKVIMFNVSKANYDDFVQYDGRLLYVGITRALHELFMISLREPTRFLKESRLIDVYNER